MTVGQLLREMNTAELVEWWAYFNIKQKAMEEEAEELKRLESGEEAPRYKLGETKKARPGGDGPLSKLLFGEGKVDANGRVI